MEAAKLEGVHSGLSRSGWTAPPYLNLPLANATLLAARAGLVAMHRDATTDPRRTQDLWLGMEMAAGAFEARVRQPIAGNPLLAEVIEALHKVWRTTGEQLSPCTGACCGTPRPTRPAAA
jgi:hypothetical protein